MSKIKITRKDKFLNSVQIFILLDDFINDSFAGRRTKKDGNRISIGTIKNYEYLKRYLHEYEQSITFDFKIFVESNLTFSEKLAANKYYKKFYTTFSNFLYKEKGYFDNYVGLVIKLLRSFFNYLEIVFAYAVIYASGNYLNQAFTHWFDAVYFSIITSSSIGYGDFYPVTTFGRFLVSSQALLFLFFVVLFLNFFSTKIKSKGYFDHENKE